MDVACVGSDPFSHNVVDELDYRPLGFFFVYGIGIVDLFDHRLWGRFRCLSQHFADALDWSVNFFDALHDSSRSRERHPNFAAGGESQRLLAIEVVRIGRRDIQNRFGYGQWQDAEPSGQSFTYAISGEGAYEQAGRNPGAGMFRNGREHLFIVEESGGDDRGPVARGLFGLELRDDRLGQ